MEKDDVFKTDCFIYRNFGFDRLRWWRFEPHGGANCYSGSHAAPTATLMPPTETPELTDTVPDGFVTVVACLEAQLGSDVARTLVSGERQETAEEQAVLEACLLASASGISDEDLSPAASPWLSERHSEEVLQVVGSRARSLTPEEEGVLVDCLVTTALDTTASVSTFERCLKERLGEGLALLVASRSVPLNDVETHALNACLLVSALTVMSRQLRSGHWPVWRNVWERT